MSEPKILWENYEVIGAVQKGDSTKMVVALGCRDGIKYIVIREFYYTKKREAWRPSKYGLTIPYMIPIKKGTERIAPFAGLIDVLINAIEQLEDFALSDEANTVYIRRKEIEENEENND